MYTKAKSEFGWKIKVSLLDSSYILLTAHDTVIISYSFPECFDSRGVTLVVVVGRAQALP